MEAAKAQNLAVEPQNDPFRLDVVMLLSSRFIASALVWFSNFLKYLVFLFFISVSSMIIYRSS
jgi:hypothetical protein